MTNEFITKILTVALGGGMGSVMRYALSAVLLKKLGDGFPWETLMVNLIGSFGIGFLGGWFEFNAASYHARLFLITGVLGGFTTFSAFSLENLLMIRNGESKLALMNIFLSVGVGILLASIGFILAETLAGGGRTGKL